MSGQAAATGAADRTDSAPVDQAPENPEEAAARQQGEAGTGAGAPGQDPASPAHALSAWLAGRRAGGAQTDADGASSASAAQAGTADGAASQLGAPGADPAAQTGGAGGASDPLDRTAARARRSKADSALGAGRTAALPAAGQDGDAAQAAPDAAHRAGSARSSPADAGWNPAAALAAARSGSAAAGPGAHADAAAAPGTLSGLPSSGVTGAGSFTAAAAPMPTHALGSGPGQPGFAPQLGAQVVHFVRLGLAQAELQLHPAEMGPVAVQIRLQGTAAQVHLWAEQGATRQALEQALPTLASSLREAGFTLAGGGVFEQAQQARDQARDQAREPSSSADPGRTGQPGGDEEALAIGRTSLEWRPRGVVDLVA